MDILIATANLGKVREFRQMLGDDVFNWHNLSDLPSFNEVAETGETFLANACLKSSGYAMQAGMWALADDSGLEVDALAGKPGVYSARWAQLNSSGSGDADNNRTLLRQLNGVADENRTARFVCVLALADPLGKIILSADGTVDGRILHEPRGSNGFGYDPLFYVESLKKTTAELLPEEKHRISHRGNALRQLRKKMEVIGFEKGK